jgi:hypothetical protein
VIDAPKKAVKAARRKRPPTALAQR